MPGVSAGRTSGAVAPLVCRSVLQPGSHLAPGACARPGTGLDVCVPRVSTARAARCAAEHRKLPELTAGPAWCWVVSLLVSRD